MSKISGSVGRAGMNQRPDVKAVQMLLNARVSRPFVPLKPDGICGMKTIDAIGDFQRLVMHVHHPDGLILPGGPTWKRLSATGGSQANHVSHVTASDAKTGLSASELVRDPSIRAMLDTLGYSEGTGDEYGTVVHGTVIKAPNPADVGRQNVVVTDFSEHPDMLVQVNAQIKSTAAGRYQFLIGTWNELKMPDFTPASQDLAAVKLFKRRKMIAPLLGGDFDLAVQRGSLEWASLPDASNGGKSHYGGQTARTLAQLRTKFVAAFGLYAKS